MSFFSSTIMRTSAALIVLFGIFYAYTIVVRPPGEFPTGKNFIVEEGESLRSISGRLESEHYIRNAMWFRAGISFLGRDRHVQLGGYMFDRPLSLTAVINKLVFGKPDVPLIRVTIPEGSTTHEIALLLQKELPQFSLTVFNQKVTEAKANGKLFPSTYFLLPSTTESAAIGLMMQTFQKKYSDNFKDVPVPAPLTTLENIISLAAVLEGEAKEDIDMRIVAGILISRLTSGMLLQVDAAPDTYKKKGLPVEPINNPGIIAMNAALHPESSSYLYYITGRDGTMHYAKTFTEHKENIRKYLR